MKQLNNLKNNMHNKQSLNNNKSIKFKNNNNRMSNNLPNKHRIRL